MSNKKLKQTCFKLSINVYVTIGFILIKKKPVISDHHSSPGEVQVVFKNNATTLNFDISQIGQSIVISFWPVAKNYFYSNLFDLILILRYEISKVKVKVWMQQNETRFSKIVTENTTNLTLVNVFFLMRDDLFFNLWYWLRMNDFT